MANEFAVNINTTTDQLQSIWYLITRMLKAGYWLRASSNGATKVVSDDPTAHTGFTPTNTANSGSTASITAVADHPYGKLMTLTGLSGLVSPTVQGGQSEGNYLTISGASDTDNNGTHQIYEVVSATSAVVLNRNTGASAPDANNGSIVWQEKNLFTTSYTFTTTDQWWASLEGPQTYQLSFTSAVSGTFLRGEKITQTGTAATGECLGVVWDPIGSSGWMIVMPRDGYFNGTGVLTGASSTATVTPTNLYRFRRQWVFTKGNTTDNYTGSSWYGVFREDTEVANFFSTLASNANCTATVAPGGSDTVGNRLPNVGNVYVIRCSNNDTANGNPVVHTDGILSPNASGPNGRIQVGIANAMPRTNRSADGTWWIFAGNSNLGSGGNLQTFMRMDAQEEGTPEPYTHFAPGQATSSRIKREGSIGGTGTVLFNHDDVIFNANNIYEWPGVLRRSVGNSGGVPLFTLYYTSATISSVALNSGGLTMGRNWGATQRAEDHPATTTPAFKEPVGIKSGFNGRCRWLFLTQIGSVYDTFESRRYICLNTYNGPANFPAIIIGPWDQTTDPLQT